MTHPLAVVTFCECEAGQRMRQHYEGIPVTDAKWLDALRQRQQEAISRRYRSAIPAKYRAFTMDSLKALCGDEEEKKLAIAVTEAYIAQGFIADASRHQRRSLMIHGPFGAGKTALAMEVAKARLRERQTVLASTWSNLYGSFKRSYGTDSTENAEELVAQVQRVDFLLLDDLGRLTGGHAEAGADRIEKLEQIIDFRVSENLPTLVTSNLTIDQIRNQFGERLSGRIFENFTIAHMGGRDLRQDAATI